jgi:hypothetical protein
MRTLKDLDFQYKPDSGMFSLSAEDNNVVRNYAADMSREALADFNLLAAMIVRTRREYRSWIGSLFVAGEEEEIVKEDYGAFATSDSADQSVLFFQLGELYSRGQRFPIKSGFTVAMDDVAVSGINRVQRASIQAAEEMAAAYDRVLWNALYAAVDSTHILDASSLTDADWAYIVGEADEDGYPVTRAIMSRKRAMDIAGWTNMQNGRWTAISSAYGDQELRQGYIDDYLGIPIEIQSAIPSNVVVFAGDPRDRGRVVKNIVSRTLQGEDIRNAKVEYAIHELWSYVIGDVSDIWIIEVS